MSDIDKELIGEFLIESYENLDRLDGELVSLEEHPDSSETLGSIFRTIHTIKGTCGFLEFSRLETVTHAGENLLSALRDGVISMNADRATALLKLVDVVRLSLSHIEENDDESDITYPELIAALEWLSSDDRDPESAPEGFDGSTPEESEEEQASEPEPEPVAPKAEEKNAPKQANAAKSSIAQQNIRVQVGQLDGLMTLAGELVLARNQILQQAADFQDANSSATAQRLNLITTELQEGIMKIRMQPIGTLWSKFPRVVRDLSMQLGKQVKLEMEGKGTELDKTLLEAIKDPLTHLVRNSIDHGIELPADRKEAGKASCGTLSLRAYHESGQVNIEIIDDGGGINSDALRAKAVSNGLLTQDEAHAMSERAALALIYHPGLSTAKAVTNVSGRGVGMDVVKTNIESIGGTIELASEHGKGTTIRIKIPLTLAIIPALIITSAGERYAIPQVSLVELVRLEGEINDNKQIEDLNGSQVYRLRGGLLPLVFLNEALGLPDSDDPETGRDLVVVRADDHMFGLVVEEINDTEEIVVKPLDKQTKAAGAYAGTTILGDGRVSLIIDVFGLALRTGVIKHDRHQREERVEQAAQRSRQSETYLLICVGEDRRMAIRLSAVDRLEEFKNADIEQTTELEVVQYRDDIMPVIHVSDVLGQPRSQNGDGHDLQQMVVYSSDNQRFGIAVDAITDIIEVYDEVARPSDRQELESTVIIDNSITDVLCLESLVSGYKRNEKQTDEGLEAGNETSEQDAEEKVTTHQLCTFYLDNLYFGVDVMQVQEVLRHQTMTRVPLADEVVKGLINLRGQTVTALDMRTRLGIPPRYEDTSEISQDDLPMNVVLRSKDAVVSLLVDRIGDVVSVSETDRDAVPDTVRKEIRDLVTHVYKLPEKILLVLDIDQAVKVEQPQVA